MTSVSAFGRDRLLTEETGQLSADQRRHLAYWPRGAVQASVKSVCEWHPGERTDGRWKIRPLVKFIITTNGAPESRGLDQRLVALVNSCQDMLGTTDVVVEIDGEKVLDTREDRISLESS